MEVGRQFPRYKKLLPARGNHAVPAQPFVNDPFCMFLHPRRALQKAIRNKEPMMGRPRIYANSAERSRAHRQRKANVSDTKTDPVQAPLAGEVRGPLDIRGRKGQRIGAIIEDETGAGKLLLFDSGGQLAVALGTWGGMARLTLFGKEGSAAATMRMRPDKGGEVLLAAAVGRGGVLISNEDTGGELALFKPDGMLGRVVSAED